MHEPITREIVLRELGLLPVFPRIINLLLETLEVENADVPTLAAQIKRDMVLTGRLLTITNRLLRDTGREPVGDVGVAINLIGFDRLRNLVMMATMHVLNDRLEGSAHNWAHALAVGVAAQELACKAGDNPEWAMVAGLLHDIGQVWLRRFAPERYTLVFRGMALHDASLSEVEQQVFGLDHGEVGGIITEAWCLPDQICAAVRDHHAPGAETAPEKLGAAVYVAELIANALDLPYREENEVATLDPAAWACLGLSTGDDLVDLLGQVQARYRYAESFFSM